MKPDTEHTLPEDRQDPAARHLHAGSAPVTDPGPDFASGMPEPATDHAQALTDPASDLAAAAEPLVVVNQDDPSIFEEFGALATEDEQGVYDWFALDMVDPLDVDDDERPRDEVGAINGPADPPPAAAGRPPPNASSREPDPAAHAGGSRPRAPNGESATRPRPGIADIPRPGEGPSESPPGRGKSRRLRLPGRAGRRLIVFLLAALAGLAMMATSGPDRARLFLDDLFAKVYPLPAADPPAGTPAVPARDASAALTPSPPAGEPAPEDRSLAPAFRTDMLAPASPGLAAGTLQIDLRPVAATANLVPIGTARAEEWNRLFEFIDRPPPAANTNNDAPVPEEISDPPERPPLPKSSHPGREFTPDDGFTSQAATPLNSDLAGYGPDGLATDLAAQGPQTPAAAPTPNDSTLATAPPPQTRPEILARIDVVETNLTGITQQLAAIDRQLRHEPGRQPAGEFHLPQASTISTPFRTPATGPRPTDRGRYLVSASLEGTPTGRMFAGIAAGDHVEGFGKVIDITSFDEGGQLYVMEHGAVFID